jgi:hypothetical protein
VRRLPTLSNRSPCKRPPLGGLAYFSRGTRKLGIPLLLVDVDSLARRFVVSDRGHKVLGLYRTRSGRITFGRARNPGAGAFFDRAT